MNHFKSSFLLGMAIILQQHPSLAMNKCFHCHTHAIEKQQVIEEPSDQTTRLRTEITMTRMNARFAQLAAKLAHPVSQKGDVYFLVDALIATPQDLVDVLNQRNINGSTILMTIAQAPDNHEPLNNMIEFLLHVLHKNYITNNEVVSIFNQENHVNFNKTAFMYAMENSSPNNTTLETVLSAFEENLAYGFLTKEDILSIINHQDLYERTAFTHAASSRYLAACSPHEYKPQKNVDTFLNFLLSAFTNHHITGEDVFKTINHADKFHWTPLMYAITNPREEYAALATLLNFFTRALSLGCLTGKDVIKIINYQGAQGETAISLARNSKLKKLLIDALKEAE